MTAHWIEDSKAFIFEFKNREMRKYPIKDKKKAFSAGFSLHDNVNIGDGDINLRTKEIGGDYVVKCKPKSYDYGNVKDALIWNKGEFKVTKKCIIYMKETEEYHKYIEIERDKKRPLMMEPFMKENKKEIEQIQQWTKRKVCEILFHHDVDDWRRYSSTFYEKIKDKTNFIIFFESEYKCKFGCYYTGDDEISQFNITQIKGCFLFTFKDSNPKVFEINKNEIKIHDDKNDELLMNFGNNIEIRKEGYPSIDFNDSFILSKIDNFEIEKQNHSQKRELVENFISNNL